MCAGDAARRGRRRSWLACATRPSGTANRCDEFIIQTPSASRKPGSQSAHGDGDPTANGAGDHAVPAAAYYPGSITKRRHLHSGTMASVPTHGAQSAAEAQVGLSVTDVRRLWPDVLEEVKGKRRFTWILLSQNARVAELRNGTLLLAMSNPGARDSFARGGNEDVTRGDRRGDGR